MCISQPVVFAVAVIFEFRVRGEPGFKLNTGDMGDDIVLSIELGNLEESWGG